MATNQIVTEITKAVRSGLTVAPVTFSACYGRANTAAAFRMARARGLIVVDYISCGGTPVYRMGLTLTK